MRGNGCLNRFNTPLLSPLPRYRQVRNLALNSMKKSKSFNGTPATSPDLKGIKYKISGLVQRDYRVLNMKRSAPTDYIVNNTKHTHSIRLANYISTRSFEDNELQGNLAYGECNESKKAGHG